MLVVQGIQKNADQLKISQQDVSFFLQALAHDKVQVSKCLLKSLYWAISLPQGKSA